VLEYCNYGDEQPSDTHPLALLWEFIMTGVKFICWNHSGSGALCFFCLEWTEGWRAAKQWHSVDFRNEGANPLFRCFSQIVIAAPFDVYVVFGLKTNGTSFTLYA